MDCAVDQAPREPVARRGQRAMESCKTVLRTHKTRFAQFRCGDFELARSSCMTRLQGHSLRQLSGIKMKPPAPCSNSTSWVLPPSCCSTCSSGRYSSPNSRIVPYICGRRSGYIGPPFPVCAGTPSLEKQLQCELEVAVLRGWKLCAVVVTHAFRRRDEARGRKIRIRVHEVKIGVVEHIERLAP